ncbi:MAG: hypothetical protein II886_13215 [Prevotella sp.]|nr:hypothetical protein [Prevotella sp.]
MKKNEFYSTILTLGKKSKLFMLSLNRMVLFAFTMLLAIAACTNKPVAAVENDTEGSENKDIVLVNKQAITRSQAIVDYLSKEIGSQYAKGEHCVPFYTIISWDDSNTEDVKMWGDFWVFNYNQVGDTLKCVSGGCHPGLMHMQYTAKGFEVIAFDQVEDGSRNLPSAKRIFGDKYDTFHAVNSDAEEREDLRRKVLANYVKKNNLNVTMYQDYGWPAQKLEE